MGMSGMGRRVDRASNGSLQTSQELRRSAQQDLNDAGANHPAEQPFAEKERPSFAFAKLGDKLGDQLKMLQRG